QAGPAGQFLFSKIEAEQWQLRFVHGLTHNMAGDEFPCFVRGECQNWCEQTAQTSHQGVQGRLRRAAPWRASRIGVETILDDVMVNRRELHRHKLTELLVNGMKLAGV